MPYRADPGGIFESDAHRRVLAHLSRPQDNEGYTVEALLHRLEDDGPTNFTETYELQAVLNQLVEGGDAVEHDGGIFQQSEQGFDKLTGPIANEPDPNETPKVPARLDAPTPLS